MWFTRPGERKKTMKVRGPRFLLLLVLLGSLTFGLSPTAAQDVEPPRQPPTSRDLPMPTYGPKDEGDFKAGEVVVKFRRGTPAPSVNSMLANNRATRLKTLDLVDAEVWQVQKGNELSTIERLKANPAVEYAEPNYRYYALGIPNDSDFGEQWGPTKVQAPAAWDVTQGSDAIVIAIIDTGIDASHPDLAGKIVPGIDFVDGDADPRDENGHGTHVAGIAAALTNNGIGIAGMSWNAKIMPVRVLDRTGAGYNTDVAAGINWAFQHGAKVLNLSLGSISSSALMESAVNAAYAHGSLVVAAMGNCRTECTINDKQYTNPTTYPAAYNHVMAVAATSRSNPELYAYYSQTGSHCDIAAPGGETDINYADGIYSTLPTYSVYLNTQWGYFQNYDYLQGTSQATPFVSGLAALVWATKPDLAPDQVEAAIEDTAFDPALGYSDPGYWDPDYGYGRIDALAAVQVYSPPLAPVLSSIGPATDTGDYLVDWSDVDNTTGYELQEADNAAFAPVAHTYTGLSSQHQVYGQGPGTWYYRVRAYNANGNSPWSSVQSVTVRPDPPTLNDISNGGQEDAYQISWAAAAATSYTLEEAKDAGFYTRYMGSATQYQVTGQAGGTWHYRVRAANAGGTSDWSAVVSTTVAPPHFQPPATVTITNPTGDNSYSITWSEVAGATGYRLEHSRDPWFSAPTEVYSGTTPSHDVANQPGGRWYYRVRATAPAGNSPWSATQSTVVFTRIFLPLIERPINIAEGFESGLMPPPDWLLLTQDTSLPTRTWFINTDRPFAGSYYASCNYDPDRVQNEVLLSPQFKASTARVQFESFGSLDYCSGVNPACSLNVWLVVGAMDGVGDTLIYRANQDWLGEYEWSPSDVSLTPHLPPPGTPVRVGFQYYGQNGAQISLDSIVISGN
jgi:thermitase